MAKKKGGMPVKAMKAAAPKKPNPFELKKTKTKFDVIGRRIGKNQTKNVIQARSDAINRVRSSGRRR